MSFVRALAWKRALAWGSALSLFSCSGNPSPEVPLTPWGAESFTWAPCPEELGGARVDCTQVEVPQSWAAEDDPERTSILLRRRTATENSRGRLWTLDGGPGFAGDAFFDPVFTELVDTAGLDLYVPSHRGSLGASALACPGAQASSSAEGARVTPEEWPSCLKELEETWGKGLPGFTVRDGALDVAHAMKLMPQEGVSYLFGGSYGSLWAQRLLLDTDARLDAVLLDSIVPVGASLERVDEAADGAVQRLFAACQEEEECAGRFELPPLESAQRALMLFDENQGCGQTQGVTRLGIQHLARELLDGPPEAWVKLIALFEALARCAAEDAAALLSLTHPTEPVSPEADTSSPNNPRYNPLLNRHLLYRELYRFDQSRQERDDFEASALALSSGRQAVQTEALAFGANYRQLDSTKRDTSQVPTTLLSGQLDPLDPPKWAEQFTQTLTQGSLISLPWAGHSTLRYLGWQENACGRRLFTAFLHGESTALPCTTEQSPPDLGRSETKTQELIDAWLSSTD